VRKQKKSDQVVVQMYDFRPKPGSGLSKQRARMYGQRIVEVSAGGRVDPHEILDDAKSPASPLHDYYEWDNAKRAHDARIDDTRQLLQSILIIQINRSGAQEAVRAFPHTGSTGYQPLHTVLSSHEMMSSIYHSLLDSIIYWKMQAEQWSRFIPFELKMAERIEKSLAAKSRRKKKKVA